MSIRPVDMQIQMPRAMESSRTGAHDNAKPHVAQQMFTSQVQKHVAQQQQSVIQSNKTEEQNVNKDGRGNSGGYSRKNRQRNTNSREKDTAPEKKSLLDISL